jgi:ACS family glucarate transporter-like MFS transporter
VTNSRDSLLTVASRSTAVRRWGLVVLLFLSAAASLLSRVNLSVVGAMMMRDLGFSEVVMGRLFSAFLLGYAIFQIPAGAAADRWGAPRVLAWAALWWALITILISAVGSPLLGSSIVTALTVLLMLRFILGVGEAPTFPASAQGVSKWIPPKNQGLASGIVLAALGAGSAIAPILLSRVMVRWGWRFALKLSAVPALIVSVAWMSVVRSMDDPPKEVRSGGQPFAHQASTLRRSFRSPGNEENSGEERDILWSPSFILLTLSYTLEGYVGDIFIYWFYLYLVQVRHFDLLYAGKLSSLPWILCLISIPFGGVVSDYLVTSSLGSCWGRRAVPMAGLTLSGIFLALGARTSNANYAVVYLALATAFVLSVEGPFWATMVELAGKHSGTAGGVMNCGSNIGGMISPALTPVLAVHMGWENALYVGAVIALLSAIMWLGISPQIPPQVRLAEA